MPKGYFLDKFDVIVVGCGPAGSAAARVAAGRGLNVMIIDRRRSVGQPPRCAGFVPSWLPERAFVDAGTVLQKVDGVRFVGPSGTEERTLKGCVLDRIRFDKTLAIDAMESGADLCHAFVLSREGGRVIARRNGIEAVFEGEIVIGADGPASVIARSLGVGPAHFAASLQYEVGLKGDDAWVEFRRPLYDGHGVGWFVPSGRTAKLGVALPRRDARYLKPLARRFLKELDADGRIHGSAILSATGGLLPLNVSPAGGTDGRAVLAGDAAGLSFPMGGAGIASSLLCGEAAGAAAGDALTQEDPDALRAFDSDLARRRGRQRGSKGGDALEQALEMLGEWARTPPRPAGRER